MLELEPHPSIALAQELRDFLADLTLPVSVGTVEFKFAAVPELDLADLQTASQVIVIGRSLDSVPSSRSATTETPEVDFCVRTKCTPSDHERVQLFASFAWTLGREILAQRHIASYTPLKVTSSLLYQVDRLRTHNEFLINQTVQFRAMMEH